MSRPADAPWDTDKLRRQPSPNSIVCDGIGLTRLAGSRQWNHDHTSCCGPAGPAFVAFIQPFVCGSHLSCGPLSPRRKKNNRKFSWQELTAKLTARYSPSHGFGSSLLSGGVVTSKTGNQNA
ncbi:hypothetical protein J6590_015125 [Homalodisca vitripennis]|nr:hypothetical protein J6590_015125 [Homalodisca vitripennis]